MIYRMNGQRKATGTATTVRVKASTAAEAMEMAGRHGVVVDPGTVKIESSSAEFLTEDSKGLKGRLLWYITIPIAALPLLILSIVGAISIFRTSPGVPEGAGATEPARMAPAVGTKTNTPPAISAVAAAQRQLADDAAQRQEAERRKAEAATAQRRAEERRQAEALAARGSRTSDAVRAMHLVDSRNAEVAKQDQLRYWNSMSRGYGEIDPRGVDEALVSLIADYTSHFGEEANLARAYQAEHQPIVDVLAGRKDPESLPEALGQGLGLALLKELSDQIDRKYSPRLAELKSKMHALEQREASVLQSLANKYGIDMR